MKIIQKRAVKTTRRIKLNSWIHPGLVIGLGGLFIPFIPWKTVKQVYFITLPLVGLFILVLTSTGLFGEIPAWPGALHKWQVPFLQYHLDIIRINKMSMLFGYVYVIAAFCMNLYALKAKNHWEHVVAMIYVGSALGAIFSGDLFSLFFCLEIMSWAPFFLLLFRGTTKSRGAAFRYIIWHHVSGLCILAGILMHAHQTGSIEFSHMPWGWGAPYWGSNLMLLGFVINSATVPFHSWLSDAYSEASPSGSVYMTAYTTKTAVFCMITAFAGVELLIWMGVISAMFAVFMAVLENDGRRLLSYHIISQVGYMVAGVGIGTEMAINGAAAHAFCHIIYKSLLYMGAGCVLTVAGTAKFHQLGGLYKYMPISFWMIMIGAFSISGFPIFSGFVSKTMTIEASELANLPIVYLMLEGASIGTFLHTGLKLPWNIWLQGQKEPPPEIHRRLKDSPVNSPVNMLSAMGVLSCLCLFIGIYPDVLYALLPYPVAFVPYTVTRVFTSIQLFIFSFLGFWLLRKWLKGHPTYVLDTDWPARILGSKLMRFCKGPLPAFGAALDTRIMQISGYVIKKITSPHFVSFMTPVTIRNGVLIILILFSSFLIFRI